MTCCLCDSGTTSESPAPKCKNTSCRICLKVANIDTEINQAVVALQRLLTKRCDLRSERNHTHDIMHRLPLELKTRIFELALPTRDKWGGDVEDEWPQGKSPSYLTSICRNWRDIARSNPFLWSTIPIVLGTPSTSDPNWVDFVYDWIQRSRNSPLTLHISIYDNIDDNDDSEDDMEEDKLEEQLNDVLNVMAQCPNEWQSLSLDIPFYFLYIFHGGDNDFKSHLLTVRRLRISTIDWDDVDQPVHLTMNPEMIEIIGLSFKLLPISWNHLTFVEVSYWDLEDVMQLFQHASQMIFGSISHPQRGASDFAMPPIIHRMLQTLRLRYGFVSELPMLLDSLTLPCLRAIETKIDMVVTALLPSLLRRSSCPLTRITILEMKELPSNLHPLPGVTDLVLEKVYDVSILKVLLLEGYFPDLRHLTLPLHSFVMLWEMGVIPMLLDRNRVRPNELPLRNIFVVDPQVVDKSNPMWDSDFGKQLKVFQSSISLRGDGFEFLIPEVVRGDEGDSSEHENVCLPSIRYIAHR
jgi:hypothetical protein